MRLANVSATASVTAALLLLWWASAPPEEVVLDSGCKASGLRNILSSSIHSRDFWSGQLALLRAKQSELSRLSGGGDQDLNFVNPIEKRMSALSQGSAADPQQRELFEQEQQRRRLEFMAWLSKCESVASGKLR
ncbi:hypothetical protein FACS1894205_6220 [Alphaproteobacteria bacterium]|nr:hypothetical protein FACS1894205_6220 [Alphaproteobacteria bacterium]